MAKSVMQHAFSKGEIDPNLYARTDFAGYATGAALMRNFFVDYRGGAANRAGLEFICPARDNNGKVRLYGFQFSTIQTYMLIFSDRNLRFIMDGGLITEGTKIITTTNKAVTPTLFGVVGHGYSVGDTVQWTSLIQPVTPAGFIPLPSLNNGYYLINSVPDANHFTLSFLDGTPIDLNLYSSSALSTTGRVDKVYEIATPYLQEDLIELKFVQKDDVLTITHVDYVPRNLTRTGHTAWTLTTISIGATISPPTITSATASSAGSTFFSYVVTAVGVNGQESTASARADLNSVLDISTIAGSITLVWTTVTAAEFYNIYKAGPVTGTTIPTGSAFGFAGSVDGTSFADGNILQDYTTTPPEADNPFTGGNNPGSVAYFQQRRIYAASTASPQTFWMSKPGAFDNFDASNPIRDDDSINATLFSNQVNNIKYMVSMPGGLVILTGGGAWQISGGGQGEPISANSIVATPQAYNGISDVPPILINYDILYVQAQGAVVRDLSYNFFVNIYTGTDISVLSSHLLTGYQVVEWAYAEDPHKIIWVIRNDGRLLSLTFLKEQEVNGWAQHDTQGLFKSVASIKENDSDAVYFVVRRYIGGRWVQYIERLHDRHLQASDSELAYQVPAVENAFFVDAGISSDRTFPAATLMASSVSGSSVAFTADANVFLFGTEGYILRMGGGIATITSVSSQALVYADILTASPITNVMPVTLMPYPAAEGEWTVDAPFDTISGMPHLEGQTITILGDGNVFSNLTVSYSSVSLPVEVSVAHVGLQYTSQLQSLFLEFGESDGTIQGKRKNIPSVTVRVVDTRGLEMGGPGFDHMTEFKQRTSSTPTTMPLMTGDQMININGSWSTSGQICVRQTYPLPATILGLIPEVLMGDTEQ